jgi:predicted metal-dependent phosphoesterase TrpH
VASVAEILEHVENNTDLTLIAITDHDEVRGGIEAREIAAQRGYRVEVVPGCEVTTIEGHLIALFVERPLRMLQSLERTIDEVHAQGGLCIVPHPMSWLTLSVGRSRLLRVANHPSPSIYFDGIETFNPSIAGRVAHDQAHALNDEVLDLAELGGSDAHALPHIGTARTLYPGRTADDFRRAIAERQTTVSGEFWTANDHLQGLAEQQFRALILHPSQKIRRALNSAFGQAGRGKPGE